MSTRVDYVRGFDFIAMNGETDFFTDMGDHTAGINLDVRLPEVIKMKIQISSSVRGANYNLLQLLPTSFSPNERRTDR
jgi:hypothetical protein